MTALDDIKNRKMWKEEYNVTEFSPEAFLNGLEEKDSSQLQQMLHYMAKEIIELKKRIEVLENAK